MTSFLLRVADSCPVFLQTIRVPSAFVAAGCLLSASAAMAAEPMTGQQIYQQQCADCHGPAGAGNREADPGPLVGDKSVRELTRHIEETMPEGEPELCVGEEAERVARYIHEAFYSEIAQARNAPATLEFARLTVRQYENAIADLLRQDNGLRAGNGEQGLRAEYFHSRHFDGKRRVQDRRDPTVDFDFGAARPFDKPAEEQPAKESKKSDKDESRQFSVKWQGSLLAPETGDYEFVVRTENGIRLWVNDHEHELIDAWVQSGPQTEHRASLRLLGGRVYPLRLEMFRDKEASASVHLLWKPPHHAEEVIPPRYLSPEWSHATYVLTTPLPPDDRSTGYERGIGISQAWDEATTYAALEVATQVSTHLRELAQVKADDQDRAAKLQDYCRKFAERAFRRPLTDDEVQRYIARPFDQAADVETVVKGVVLRILKSPWFLYREVALGEFDDFHVASWMSFALWDSIPDETLFQAAARGELRRPDQLRRQAERMVPDLRTRSKLREFFHQWLKVDRFPELAKDSQTYPDFDETIASDLRTSLDLFIDDVVWSESSDFRRLLLADEVFLNDRLARFYGADAPRADDFSQVTLEPEHRAGVLSHPYLLAGFSYDKASSPIHRGVFVAHSLLGRRLNPPPVAVAPIAPQLHPDLTTRERVMLQTSPSACVRCHSMINPLGFSLEHFDAVGRFRDQEQGKPIDAVGEYTTQGGDDVRFGNARTGALPGRQ